MDLGSSEKDFTSSIRSGYLVLIIIWKILTFFLIASYEGILATSLRTLSMERARDSGLDIKVWEPSLGTM